MEWTLDKIKAYRAVTESARTRLANVRGARNDVLLARALGDILDILDLLAGLPEVVDGAMGEQEMWQRRLRREARR